MADRPSRTQRAAELADRRSEMLRLATHDRLTQAEIAARYGITQQAVSEQIRKAISERPTYAIDEYRAIESDKLDQAERLVRDVLSRRHFVVSQGRVVTMPDPDTGDPVPLVDDAPILNAVDRLVRISARRSALLGLDVPVKTDVGGDLTVRYEIGGVDLGALR